MIRPSRLSALIVGTAILAPMSCAFADTQRLRVEATGSSVAEATRTAQLLLQRQCEGLDGTLEQQMRIVGVDGFAVVAEQICRYGENECDHYCDWITSP